MFISDRLSKLAHFYHREARRCARSRAYLAACVMEGAALETLLQAMCFLYPSEVRRTTTHQQKRFRTRRNKPLEFTFFQLINIAAECQWFPPKVIRWGKQATLAGFAHELRQLRNYVHPGKWAPKHPDSLKFTAAVYGVAAEIAEVANSWLLYKVNTSLRRAMEKEGLF